MLNTIFIRNYCLRAEAGAEGGGAPADSTQTTATTPAGNAPVNAADTPPATPEGSTPAQAEPAAPNQTADSTPEYSEDAAKALENAYALNPDDSKADPAKTDNSAADGYTVTFPEDFAPADDAGALAQLLAPIAKESGLEGPAFGGLFAKSYAAIQEAQKKAVWQERFQQDAQLKKDWGSQYESNMATARGHLTFLKEKAGLTDDDLAVFASPKGMRALYAMASAGGERQPAGLAQQTAGEKAWADDLLHNPNHPDREAFYNPNHPRYKEVNARWRRANGAEA